MDALYPTSPLEAVEQSFVDQIATYYETQGLSPTAGRILGRLLMARPPEQSSKELATYLQASKGAISSQTQLLIQAGFIDKTRRAGSRETWYRLRDDVWLHLLEQGAAGAGYTGRLADALMKAQEEAGGKPSVNLKEFRSVQRFFEQQMPRLIQEWRDMKRDT